MLGKKEQRGYRCIFPPPVNSSKKKNRKKTQMANAATIKKN